MNINVRDLLGIDAEHDLCDTMRHGNTAASDMIYLRKLGAWFKKHLHDNQMRDRLFRLAEKVKKTTSYVQIERR